MKARIAYNFLVDNANLLHPTSQRLRSIDQLIACDSVGALSNESILRNLCEYRFKSYFWKLDSLDYISVADSMDLPLTTFRNWPPIVPNSVE